MKRPFPALLVAFASGVGILQACPRLPPLPGALLCVAAGLAFAALFIRVRAQRTQAAASHIDSAVVAVVAWTAAVAASGLSGFSYAAWRAHVRLADELPSAWEERDLRVTGIVDDLPQPLANGVRFAFAVDGIDTPGAIVPHRVSLAWFAPRSGDAMRSGDPRSIDPARVPDASSRGETSRSAEVRVPAIPIVHAGECWSFSIRLKRPHGNVNPDGFDLEAWLLERNLRATGHVRESAAGTRRCAFAGRLGDYVQRSRERVRIAIAAALPNAPYAGVLTALAIGDQRAVPEWQWNVFNRTGVTHLVSISGLHVTVFATLAGGCALLFFRRITTVTMRIPARKLAAVAGVCCAFGYVLLAGAEVPAVRTFLMLAVAAAGLWIGRPGTAMLVWLWSLAAVVLWDPWASLAPGFWLSFGAVGLLLYAGSGRLADAVPRTLGGRLARTIREAARAQWVVTLGLVPGTLALFGQVSLVSALANALAIPVITLAVVPLALFSIAVPVEATWRVAHAVLACLMRCLEWMAAMPSATWSTHAPRGWTVAVAIGGVCWLLAPRGTPGRLLGAAWLLPMALLPPPAVSFGGARVTVLDVGQGLAVVVATAHHALLYDAGPRFSEFADAGTRIVMPFLRASGVARLDTLVVSHADSDHSGGAKSILDGVPVQRLMSSLPTDHPIVMQARRSGQATRCIAGERWEWDGVVFTVLHPAPNDYASSTRKSNDLSCVLKVDAAGGAVLLTGDIEAAAESELLALSLRMLRSDVLVVPHHGSRTSSTPGFIAAVSPGVAVIAAGYRNRFGHPRAEVLARYRRAGAAHPRTDLEGAITVTIAPGRPIVMEAERERRRRYWYDTSTD